MRMNIRTAVVCGAILVPSLVLAANIGSMDFKGFVYFIISDFIRPSITVLFALAVVYFLWNIAEVIRESDDPAKLATLKTKAFWGVVAIFVMASLWGLVGILVNTFISGSKVPVSSSGNNIELNVPREKVLHLEVTGQRFNEPPPAVPPSYQLTGTTNYAEKFKTNF